MNELFFQLEQHPAATAVVIFILSSISYFLFKKNKTVNNKTIHKSAGRDIIEGNVYKTSQTPNNIKTFEKYVDESHWSNKLINNKEVWICDDDNAFQIKIDENSEHYSEKWMRRFSTSNEDNSEKHEVILSINGIKVESCDFVILSSGRIIVPIAKFTPNNGEGTYYWERNSLDFKISKIIGSFDFYKTIEKVAEMAGIEIR